MDSPFKLITDAFQPHYYVNFSVERHDGTIVLTLSTDEGVAVKRFISAAQLQDEEKLKRLILGIQLGLEIEKGAESPALLAVLSQQGRVAQSR